MKQTKKDLMALRAELKSLSHRREAPSTTRRESNTRRESATKPQTRASINVKAGSSGLLPDLNNKENQPSQQQVQPQTKEELASAHRIPTPKEATGEASKYDKDIEGIQTEVNTLGLCLEELKGYVEELRKRDIRVTSALVDLQKKNKDLSEQTCKDTERLENQIKNIRITAIVPSPQPANENKSDKEEPAQKKEEKNLKTEREKGERTERVPKEKRVS